MLDFIEPAYSPTLVSFIHAIWPAYIKVRYQGLQIKISPDVKEAFQSIEHLAAVICPNHCALEDPEILFGLARAVKQQFLFLAARELFGQRNALRSWWYQKVGCFSVERGRADVEAFKAARDLLVAGKKVVIFPEGEISRRHDWLLDLENGAEHMALAASETLSKTESAPGAIFIVPLAIKYRYGTDMTPALDTALKKVEEKLGSKSDDEWLGSRIRYAYDRMLDHLESELEIKSNRNEDLTERLFVLREHLILKCEEFLGVQLPGNLSQLSRVHILRGMLNERRWAKWTDNGQLVQPDRKLMKQHYRWIMLATDLMAIEEHSFHHGVTQEQSAELVNILEQEIFGAGTLPRPRLIYMGAGKPIDVNEYLGSYGKNHRQGILELKTELKNRLEARLQKLDVEYPAIPLKLSVKSQMQSLKL